MSKSNIFFNIIVPTKNRKDTLKSTLKTILNQNYEDYKIIVLDNNSTDGTGEFIKSLNNQSIIYEKSDFDLPMHVNWERGIKFCEKGFITILGDDDGLCPNALNELNIFLNGNETQIVSWSPNCYHWLNICSEKKNEAEIYFASNKKTKFSKFDSNTILKRIIDMSLIYLESPMIYNSFVDINLIKKIRQKKKDNIFFSNGIPDIYSGLILLLNSKEFYKANFPIGVAGISKSSIGALISKKTKTMDDIKKNMEYFKINRVPPIPSYYLSVLEPFGEICEEFEEARRYLVNFFRLKIRVEQEILNELPENKKFYKEKLNFFIKELKKNYNFTQKFKIFYNLFEISFPTTYDKIILKLNDNIENINDASLEILNKFIYFSNNRNKKIKFLDKKLYCVNILRRLGIYNISLSIFKINKIFN